MELLTKELNIPKIFVGKKIVIVKFQSHMGYLFHYSIIPPKKEGMYMNREMFEEEIIEPEFMMEVEDDFDEPQPPPYLPSIPIKRKGFIYGDVRNPVIAS